MHPRIAKESHMFKRIVFLVIIWTALLSAFSCTKTPPIEYDLDGIEGKWLVTSTTGEIVVHHDIVFAVNDTVRFYNGAESFFISRPAQNRYYDEFKDIHYFLSLGGMISEDRLSFTLIWDRLHTFELIESRKDRLVFRFEDNGAEVTMQKQE